jgi:hypothetical protein
MGEADTRNRKTAADIDLLIGGVLIGAGFLMVLCGIAVLA